MTAAYCLWLGSYYAAWLALLTPAKTVATGVVLPFVRRAGR
jgi:hypothetical protein